MAANILVVEDDSIAARLLTQVLESEGYNVTGAANGVEALKMAGSAWADLIILDVLLPGLDGFEVCHRLRAVPTTATTPVLIVSGKARDIDRITGQRVGADEYLVKPVEPQEILATVKALLSNSRSARTAGGHRTDYGRFEAF